MGGRGVDAGGVRVQRRARKFTLQDRRRRRRRAKTHRQALPKSESKTDLHVIHPIRASVSTFQGRNCCFKVVVSIRLSTGGSEKEGFGVVSVEWSSTDTKMGGVE